MKAYEERAHREESAYDKGIHRERFDSLFAQCNYFTNLKKAEYIRRFLAPIKRGRFLEIGCDCWYGWIIENGGHPEKIDVINISRQELQRGKENCGKTTLCPVFHHMDAHDLKFPDNSFDLVYGGAVLHHLELERALSEIHRVLRPGGRILFWEPLRLNPLSMAVRCITPSCRTRDERPFGVGELKTVSRFFSIQTTPYGLFLTPAGLLSQALGMRPDSALLKGAYRLDQWILGLVPPARYLFRAFFIAGRKESE
ncbi:MAG: class I SAM-dependent methyltransferase [Fibrobacterota bacterium]